MEYVKLWETKGVNKQLPENILIYRDGVSEEQSETFFREKLPLLRKACEKIYLASDLQKDLLHITIVVVGKRHHTRFYSTNGDNDKIIDKTGNPINAIVVDRHVTEARNWDSFLQSHNALQGTACPTLLVRHTISLSLMKSSSRDVFSQASRIMSTEARNWNLFLQSHNAF